MGCLKVVVLWRGLHWFTEVGYRFEQLGTWKPVANRRILDGGKSEESRNFYLIHVTLRDCIIIPLMTPDPASYIMGTGSFPGVKWPGRGGDYPPHIVPKLKKE
jgi:hypothetical protein